MARAAVPSHLGDWRRPGQPLSELTAFVGRTDELAAIGTLLDRARLVTTVGPPGVGKTRVSLRAAALAADRYPGGVWLAELSELRDPALLPAAVAACLGLPGRDARAQLPAILDYLRERRLLLILDTCEHLLDACAAFAEGVLREAPGITLLAASRQPLDVPGEHVCLVPPLPVPDAVELFARRAAAVVPGFAVTAANRADVIRLCGRLDGIPLAIELAAVRLRTLPLADLADRVESGFGVLTVDRRGVSRRHQTLGTAADWSYGLCTPAERTLWARLSVFAGPFDMAAAEQVCADADLPGDAVVEALIGLVDKSVVLREHADGPRYLLLGALREFGAAKLAEAGQEAACRGRLLDRYLAMATYFDEHFLDDDQLARYRELRREHAGIRAALEYSLGHGERAGDGAELAVRLHGYWQISGLLPEGRYWLGKAADLYPQPSGERAWALGVRGRLSTFQGDVAAALADIRESIGLAARLGEDLAAARGYLYLTLALTFAGRRDEAVAAAAEARSRMRELGCHGELISLQPQLAHLHQLAGNFDLAAEYCERGLAMLGADSGERWVTSYLNLVSGLALFQRPGRAAGRAAAIREALLAKHELGDIVGIAYALEALGWLTAEAGRPEHAAWLLGAANSLRVRTGSWLSDIAVMEVLHRRSVRRIRSALGDRRYAAAYAQGAARPLDLVVRRAIDTAGELLAAPPSEPAPALTRRELEIAAMVASGLSNREIAARLFISKRTVDAHVEHIYAKLEVSSRVQLTVWLQDQAPGIGTATAMARNGHSRPGIFSPSLTLEHARQ
jgi:non-specific serine/threonine protein kinase